jgi:hypothetical protein
MEFIVLAITCLICILICSIAFYKKGFSDGKNVQIFNRQFNYKISIQSDKPTADKKYRFYHWDMNVNQPIELGDYISYNKTNMISALRLDYGTEYFIVIARRVIENDKSSQIFLIVNPANEAELKDVL